MSRRTRLQMKGRRNFSGGFSKLVHSYWQSPQYGKLSPIAVKLLIDLLCQYRGSNNGDLTASWTVMRPLGWRSKHLLQKAQRELQARGWIIKTRQGSINKPSLWAVTFEGIDDCRDATGQRKLEAGVTPDPKPLHLWKLPDFDTPLEPSKRLVRKTSSSPTAGQKRPESRGNVTDFPKRLAREPGRC